jgi:hypothetical protein
MKHYHPPPRIPPRLSKSTVGELEMNADVDAPGRATFQVGLITLD